VFSRLAKSETQRPETLENPLMKLAALVVATAAAIIAIPAAASDLRVSRSPTPVVRIAIAGKTDAQVSAEINAAAATVCGAPAGECFGNAVRGANSQYSAIKRAHQRDANLAKVEVVREDRATIRVKVAGRSMAEINADIDSAAKTVCKVVGTGDFRGCVTNATRSAKAQLRDMGTQVASR
jgi:hypothetical protein